MLKNIDALVDWLQQNNVDTTSWGQSKAKDVKELWGELKSGEIELLNDPTLRVIHVTQVVIRRGPQILIEAEQLMASGRRRARNLLPSEKFKPGESYLDAAIRCLEEELNVTSNNIQLLPETYVCFQKRLDSYSYPGLMTQYTFHRVEALVEGLLDDSFSVENRASTNDDPVLEHFWEWRDADSFFSN